MTTSLPHLSQTSTRHSTHNVPCYLNTATGRTSLRRDGFVQVSLISNNRPEKFFPVQRNVLLLACRMCTVQTWTSCWNVWRTNGKPCRWNARLRVGPQRSKKIAFNQKPKLLSDQYPRTSKYVITNVTVTTMTYLDELWIIYWLCRVNSCIQTVSGRHRHLYGATDLR